MLMRKLTPEAERLALVQLSIKPDLSLSQRDMVIDHLFYATRAAWEDAASVAWICLHVRTGREKAVEKMLAEQEIEACLPCYPKREKRIRHRLVMVGGEPLLSGYVMVRCRWDWRAFIALEAMEHVHGLIGGAMKPMRLSDKTVKDFKDLASTLAEKDDTAQPGVCFGDKVAITSGPFVEFRGEIVQLKKTRAKVSIRLYGRESEIWMPLATLEKL